MRYLICRLFKYGPSEPISPAENPLAPVADPLVLISRAHTEEASYLESGDIVVIGPERTVTFPQDLRKL